LRIRESSYHAFVSEDTGITGRKIASIIELQELVVQYSGTPLHNRLSELQRMFFSNAFLYVTTDSELIKICSHRIGSVHASILRPAPHPGVGVYVVEGDRRTPIKATTERTRPVVLASARVKC
jgi:hypothetical protein